MARKKKNAFLPSNKESRNAISVKKSVKKGGKAKVTGLSTRARVHHTEENENDGAEKKEVKGTRNRNTYTRKASLWQL